MFCKLRPLVQPLPWRSAGAQNEKQMKNKRLKIALGLTLLPLFTFIYFIDRAILVLLPWIEQKTVKKWFDDVPLMVYSVVRVTAAFLIWLIYDLIFG
jgi:hypothetical protein